jgi:hypothetical protein
MYRLDILIPTRGRIAKLERLLATIPGQAWGVAIYPRILADGDMETYEHFKGNAKVTASYFEGHNGSVALRNYEAQLCPDGMLWAVDDMEFKPGAIESAVKAMIDHFPDGDGVIGFMQEGSPFHPTGVGLMGQRFLNRFPNKQPFFPGYFLFACQEILWLCERIKYGEGRDAFYQEPRAVVIHNHPCNHPEEMDQTHQDGRIHKREDMALIKARETAGLVWGWN